MTAVVEQVVTRAIPPADRRSWLRWGIAVFTGVETVHLTAGTLGNDTLRSTACHSPALICVMRVASFRP